MNEVFSLVANKLKFKSSGQTIYRIYPVEDNPLSKLVYFRESIQHQFSDASIFPGYPLEFKENS